MGHNGKDYYYIHWKGYPAEGVSWNLIPGALKSWEDSIKTQRVSRNSRKHVRLSASAGQKEDTNETPDA
jgi:hypothetical protein